MWFSCGAASTVTAQLLLEEISDTIIARCVVANEHPDNDRFAIDVGKWLGVDILNLRSKKYADCWEVWQKRRYINGPAGAPCTTAMKKVVRRDFSLPDDIHAFGFTSDETKRADRFVTNNPEVYVRFPLIEQGITKTQCFERLMAAGLDLPAMYHLGYNNANCVGCVKGGMGYWNKIRIDFPEVFARMVALEQDIGASCIKYKPLATLDPNAGRHVELKLPSCIPACGPEE